MIKHSKDLMEWINENTEFETYPEIKKAAIWFIAMQNARVISETYNYKDIANMLLIGTRPANSLEYVNDYLAELFEDEEDEEYIKELHDELLKQLEYHFGV